MEILFIVGVGTNIGKTYTVSQLLKNDLKNNINAGVIKPVETGSETFEKGYINSDSYIYSKLLNLKINEINKYFFKKPYSPHLAAQYDGAEIDIELIKQIIDLNAKKYDKLYIEGAGGLIVPYNTEYFTYLDLIETYKNRSKVIVITNNILGTINTTMLTIMALQSKGIIIDKIFYNMIDKNTDDNITINNMKSIEDLSKIEVYKI